jgi:chaperonin GroEL (HSP60 family)
MSGTCSVILLTGQLLHEAKGLVFSKGIHPNIIRKGFEKAAQIASFQLEALKLNLLSVPFPAKIEELMILVIEPQVELLRKIASVTLATKIDDIETVTVTF